MADRSRFWKTLIRFMRSDSSGVVAPRLSVKGAPTCVALAFVFIAGATAQPLLTTLDSKAIMGFETPAGWVVKGGPVATVALSTKTRTQGNFALQVANAANQTTLTSLPVASTATALAGVGRAGAIFEVDVMLPTQRFSSVKLGNLQLYISSHSARCFGKRNLRVSKSTKFSFRRL